MKPIRLGIVGTGIAARKLHMPPLLRLKDRFRVRSVFNHHGEKARKFAADFKIPRVADSFQALLRDPSVDVVLLTLPIRLNPSMSLRVLGAGKPVICEKPLAPSLAAGKTLLRKASRYKLPLLTTENYAFDPLWDRVAEALKAGRIGKPLFFQMQVFQRMVLDNEYARTSWRKKPAHLGGFLGDGGVHIADLLRRVFGMPERVRSRSLSIRPSIRPKDSLYAQLEYKSGLTGHFAYGFSHASRDWMRFRVVGTEGDLEVRGREILLKRGRRESRVRVARENTFYLMYRHYYDVLARGKRNRYPIRAALGDLELIHRLIYSD